MAKQNSTFGLIVTFLVIGGIVGFSGGQFFLWSEITGGGEVSPLENSNLQTAVIDKSSLSRYRSPSIREKDANEASARVLQAMKDRGLYDNKRPFGRNADFFSAAPVDPRVILCEETDGGFNIGQKGRVLWKTKPMRGAKGYEDETVGDGIVEYYCHGNNVKAVFVPCTAGLGDGVCMQGEPESIITR